MYSVSLREFPIQRVLHLFLMLNLELCKGEDKYLSAERAETVGGDAWPHKIF